MPAVPIAITPRRSVALFALLAITMVFLSYVVVLAVAAACVYLPYLALTGLERVNGQMLVLLVGGIVIAGTVVYSIIPRPDRFVPPGPLLDRSAHPRLFAELDYIAGVLREPLPQEVYLIGDVNAYVGDRGGLMGFGSHRIMGLGLPLLSTLTISEFRAVLAHEFAHYYGGDTALGPWIYKSQTAVARTFRNISTLGESAKLPGLFRVMQSVVAYVLSHYFVFFLRVIHFVYRKNEFRADEIASLVAGSAPLCRGLRMIHGAGLAWAPYWYSEVNPVIKSGSLPPLGDGFARFLAAPKIALQVEAGIEKEIADAKSDPFDSHPPLKDRLDALQRIPSPDLTPDSSIACSLLNDPLSVERLFVETLNPDIPKGSLRAVAWGGVTGQVILPAWRAAVADHLEFLQGYTVGHLAGAVRDVSKFAAQIKDPKGTLLSYEDRTERAAQLFAISTALCLVEHGWELNNAPGICVLERGGTALDVFALLNDLRSGTLTPEAWDAKSRELGIAEFRLGSPPQQVSAAC